MLKKKLSLFLAVTIILSVGFTSNVKVNAATMVAVEQKTENPPNY